jgi:hypothetical protein
MAAVEHAPVFGYWGFAEKEARPYLAKAGIENWAPDMLKDLDKRIAELEEAGWG